jgi:hypothetical protein
VSRRSLVIVILVCSVAGVALAVSALDARVDRLTMAARIGISAGPATPEAQRLADDWWRWLEISNRFTAITLWLVIFSGVPLAGGAAIAANWPRAIGVLVRSRAAVRVCLTLQAMNLGFAVLLMLVAAAGFADAVFDVAPACALIGAACFVFANFLAVRVWRDQLTGLTERPL